MALVGGHLVSGSTTASADGPVEFGYAWVCAGGRWNVQYQGVCYAHLPNATLTWHFAGSGWTSGRMTSIRNGAAKWDQTNGHQLNLIEDAYPGDGYSGHPVTWWTTQICGEPAAVGCTTYGINGSAQLQIYGQQFRATSYLTHTAAHEFGHAIGVGHGSDPNSVMRSATATTLSGNDTEGRCHIYGHALGLWGGCPCVK
jgi:hypothetical protein